MSGDQTESDSYPNIWRLIDGCNARKIAGFGEEHYANWRDSNKDDPTSVRILQIEYDLFDDHPKIDGRVERLFESEDEDFFYRYNCLDYAIHGTASASIIADDEKGVAPGARLYFAGISKKDLINHPNANPYKIAPVIRKVADTKGNGKLRPGDIISISAQLSQKNADGDGYNFPIDADDEIRRLINKLTENGMIVFIAAGNSRINLDSENFVDGDGYRRNYLRATQSSQAVKVGYTGMQSGSRHWSNHGSSVQFFVPSGSVSAACYDYHSETKRSDLIDTFVGGFGKTSAATPIVAAIAAKVQRLHKKKSGGQHLNRDALVNLMTECGDAPILCSDQKENAKIVGKRPIGEKIEQFFS